MMEYSNDRSPESKEADMNEILVAGVDTSTQSCKVRVTEARTGRLVRFGKAPHPAGTSVNPMAWWKAFHKGVLGRPWLLCEVSGSSSRTTLFLSRSPARSDMVALVSPVALAKSALLSEVDDRRMVSMMTERLWFLRSS